MIKKIMIRIDLDIYFLLFLRYNNTVNAAFKPRRKSNIIANLIEEKDNDGNNY